MRWKKLSGMLLILSACFIVFLNHGFTGAVIGLLFSSIGYSDLAALVMLVAGILLHLHGNHEGTLEKNIAADILKSGAVITDPKKIEKIARKMGYEEKEVKEGHQIIYNNHPLTVIPRHNISKGVYYSIMKALSSGESNFRKYSHA